MQVELALIANEVQYNHEIQILLVKLARTGNFNFDHEIGILLVKLAIF